MSYKRQKFVKHPTIGGLVSWCSMSLSAQIAYIVLCPPRKLAEWLRERTKHLDTFLFFRPSLNAVLFPMFCLLVEGECQILVF